MKTLKKHEEFHYNSQVTGVTKILRMCAYWIQDSNPKVSKRSWSGSLFRRVLFGVFFFVGGGLFILD